MGTLFSSVTLLVLVLVGGGVLAVSPVAAQTNQSPPPITSISTPAAVSLAQYLQKVGAKMYGAYWCPHCHDQEEMFGKQAFAFINYIECDPHGVNAHPDLCQAADVQGYPTWVIKGKTYLGVQSLQDLAKASGYHGNLNF